MSNESIKREFVYANNNKVVERIAIINMSLAQLKSFLAGERVMDEPLEEDIN